MVYDNFYCGISEVIPDFWRGPSAGSTVKHVGCAASPDANKIIGISTDNKDWYFHSYTRDGNKVEKNLEPASKVLNVKGSINSLVNTVNSIELSQDCSTMVVGGNSGGKCMIVAGHSKLAGTSAVVQYIEKQDNSAPTVIARFPGYDYFLAGIGGNLFVYALEKNLRLKKVHELKGICNGIISDICVKGNTVYLKANCDNILTVVLFGESLKMTASVPMFGNKIMRQHHVSLNGNLEKIWVDPFNNVVYAGGGLGMSALKKDKLTGQLKEVRADVH